MPEAPAASTPPTDGNPRSRRSKWVTTNRGNIYYRARTSDKSTSSSTRFPRPLIQARRTRPHAIHIITYPPGYVPRELRSPKPDKSFRARKQKARTAREQQQQQEQGSPERAATPTALLPPHRRFSKLFDSFSDNPHLRRLSIFSSVDSSERQDQQPIAPALESTGVAANDVIRSCAESTHQHPQRASDRQPTELAAPEYHPNYYSALPDLLPRTQSASLVSSPRASTSTARSSSTSHLSRSATTPAFNNLHASSSRTMAAARMAPPLMPPGAYGYSNATRPGMLSMRSSKSAVSSVAEIPKPIATGSGVTCSVLLAEPNIFLSGFDHDGHNARQSNTSGTALLRGKLQLNVSKNVKIKAVQLKLIGRARTEWPEGIPPLKQDLYEEQGLRTQVLTFYNVCMEGWESEYGNQCTYKLKNSSPDSSSTNLASTRLAPPNTLSSQKALTAKDLKRLSLQNTQSRSFGKGENPQISAAQAKGFKVFYPGTYDYSFELPIDHHQLETTRLQYGSVKWELQATVERAGAFKANLHGTKEVCIVRVPDQMSLEMTEPISISRQWEDQLHYDIIISGKSFPIGSKIPIAFKLTPLAKVQVHKLKVFLTESVEYWTNDRRVTRKDPGRKILLLEKSAGKPLDPAWASSELRTVRGGELDPSRRRLARDAAMSRRQRDADRMGVTANPLPEPADNLLGDLDLGLESMWGSTEIEANVQIPTCGMMTKNRELRLHPDCSWKNVNVYHWIKIVMRISRIDPADPTGKKRRHFEISIDSPFTVLNCRATQANTVLPAYSGPLNDAPMTRSSCGCPDAQSTTIGMSPSSSAGTLPGVEGALPAMPQAAHLSTTATNPASDSQTTLTDSIQSNNNNVARPIHLLRAPSFNPPAFEEDTAPPPLEYLPPINTNIANAPPLMTPPPQYDIVVGTPSVDGLADYFTRLADYGYDEPEGSGSSDDDMSPPRILERSGRVNVAHPRTPGGRMPSRSFEITRPPVQLRADALIGRGPRTPTAS